MSDLHVVVGLGATGLSCIRYLKANGIPVAVTDSRLLPPNLSEFLYHYSDLPISLGELDENLLRKAAKIILSPGVSLQEEAITYQMKRGTPVIGDIELFALNANAPTIGITGTNAKSTVTTLVGKMAESSQLKVKVGGNLGIPALDLLEAASPDLYVLELSSFQLETTFSLAAEVATVLNVTPDHMDRYHNLDEYRAAKQRVYSNCQIAVCNRDDAYTDCVDQFAKQKFYFTLNQPREKEFGLLKKNNEIYLAYENQTLMSVHELPILGRHFQANALAALAIGHGYGFPMTAMLQTLRDFKGLRHRCQLIRNRNGVCWYNDSKGTNVGATAAAIEGLGEVIKGKLILIAGGVGKNADFTSLVPAIKKYVRSIILIGEAAEQIATAIGENATIHFANTMDEAIALANQAAKIDDSVLLSPACASFDMFKNFEHRGEVFEKLVQEL